MKCKKKKGELDTSTYPPKNTCEVCGKKWSFKEEPPTCGKDSFTQFFNNLIK